MSETTQTAASTALTAATAATLEAADAGIWDVPGVGLVQGARLTLEYAKLALALYGAKEGVIERRASHILRVLDARDLGNLVDLERLQAADDDEDEEGDER
jgi:hypothetical protein